MTERERIIVSAFTGYLLCDFNKMHKYIEEKLGRPVWTHELASDDVIAEIRDATREDFLSLAKEREERGMTREEAIYVLRNTAWLGGNEQVQKVEEAIDTVERLNKWIPLDISCPDMDERVLVFTVGREYHVWDCMSNRSDNYFWEDEEGLCHNKYAVDLWMPLPEPYEAERKEE